MSKILCVARELSARIEYALHTGAGNLTTIHGASSEGPGLVETFTASGLIADAVANALARFESNGDGWPRFALDELDNCGGARTFRRSGLTIIASEDVSHRSSLLWGTALSNAERGLRVLALVSSHDRDLIGRRLVSHKFGVISEALRIGRVNERDWIALESPQADRGLPLSVRFGARREPWTLVGVDETWDLIVIDNLDGACSAMTGALVADALERLASSTPAHLLVGAPAVGHDQKRIDLALADVADTTLVLASTDPPVGYWQRITATITLPEPCSTRTAHLVYRSDTGVMHQLVGWER